MGLNVMCHPATEAQQTNRCIKLTYKHRHYIQYFRSYKGGNLMFTVASRFPSKHTP